MNYRTTKYLLGFSTIAIGSAVVIATSSEAASSASTGNGAGSTTMNGISYSDYAGFEEKWKFVTVRYRTDSGEQRFTWGNPLAMKALEAGQTDFPDGAVFAKVGYMTEEDPDFKSSRVPSGSVRYQFMVRDKKKYASTGGWGYALFDANKVTFEGDHQAQAQACYACHQLVPNRGEVFSRPFKVSAFTPPTAPPPAAAAENAASSQAGVRFETMPSSKLPDLVKRNLPQAKTVRFVQGNIRKHIFRGTIDEIRPSLVHEVKRTGMPAALVGLDNKQFAAVYPDGARKDCDKKKSFKSVFSTNVPSSAPGSAPYLVVAYQDLCL